MSSPGLIYCDSAPPLPSSYIVLLWIPYLLNHQTSSSSSVRLCVHGNLIIQKRLGFVCTVQKFVVSTIFEMNSFIEQGFF